MERACEDENDSKALPNISKNIYIYIYIMYYA